MWLLEVLGAGIGARVHAFFTEFGMLVAAGASLAGAIVLLGIRLPPGFDAIKRIVAYVLFGAALLMGGEFDGYRRRGALDASADLRRQIEAQKALIIEKDRQAKAAADEALAQSLRRQAAEGRAADMQTAIDDFEHQEPRVETKIVRIPGKPAVISGRCDVDDAFARGVSKLDAAGHIRAAKPPAAR